MNEIYDQLVSITSVERVRTGENISLDYTHDEALGRDPIFPDYVVFPISSSEVASIVNICKDKNIPITPRGSGSGMSGGALPSPGGIVLAFDRMNSILEVDIDNHVAVVEPGVTLNQLETALEPYSLFYPVRPGESSASLGGNVATNAGGMRAIRFGVTRHHVLGLETVLGTGEIINTGGKFVKSSSGYDLNQLLIGSEGTLGIVTKIFLKLQPKPISYGTVLAPFASLDEIASAVPKIISSGLSPSVLEYLDFLAMASATKNVGLDLAIPKDIQDQAMAYLVVVLENINQSRVDEDIETLCELLGSYGALDIYILPNSKAEALIDAREKAFWVAKASGADDVIDAVLPRKEMPNYLSKVTQIAAESGSFIAGCGHVGDGNVHLSLFQKDKDVKHTTMMSILKTAIDLGGAISGEHGIGVEKLPYFLALEDPIKIQLEKKIKELFDPSGILNPGHVLGS